MKNVKYIVFVLQFLFIIVNLLTIHAEKQYAHDKISSSLRKSPIASSVYDEDSQTYITPLSDENIPTIKLLRKNEKIMTNTRKKEVLTSSKKSNHQKKKVIINNGQKISLCASGGGVRAMLALWAILKKNGKSFLEQAPVISTNSGSSWFINQLLFSKKAFLDEEVTSKAHYTFREIVDIVYHINHDVEHGHDVVSAKPPGSHGRNVQTSGETSAEWLSHIAQAISKKDGWKSIVDEVNQVAKAGNGIKEAKYNMNWYQNVALLANGVFEGPTYRFCPFENFGRSVDKKTSLSPVKGNFKFEKGYCKFCPSSSPTKCNAPFKKAPTSNVYEYNLLIDGKEPIFSTFPGMVYRKETQNNDISFDVIVPFLEGKKIEIEFSPLYGRSKDNDDKKCKSFQLKNSNNYMDEENDKIESVKTTLTYENIRKFASEYYNNLWNNHREGLSTISSSAGGILNSRRYVKSAKVNPPGMTMPQAMVHNLVNSFFEKDFNAKTGEPMKGGFKLPKKLMTKGMMELFMHFMSNGVHGLYPNIGAATQIEASTGVKEKIAKLSWIDGGFADNFGLGPIAYDMQHNNNYHPFVVIASMESYHSLVSYFTHTNNGTETPLVASGGFGGFLQYPKGNLRMLKGNAPKGPSEDCAKDTLEVERKHPGKCGLVHVSEGKYTIINNEYFGLKEDTEREVKVIFVLYNEGDMSMLPGKHSQMKFAKSASKLVDVLEQAKLIVSV